MDLTSNKMYDTFKDEIWKDLGPLDPHWFEALTAQTLSNDGNVSDQDDLCANQEGNFKTPSDKTTLDSQLFSTPKAFRHSRVVSPETPEEEHSFTAEQEKEPLPWTTAQTPYLFRVSKEGDQGAKYGGIQPQSQDSFDLLHTPQKSPVSYAKHISESLGAQIHPDISWTSSLNTPPAIPSTLILTKPDESPCPASLPADKNVVFVRKLFPSLSNAFRVGAVSPKNNEMPTSQQGVVSPVPGQYREPFNSPQSSPNQSDCVWRQKLPDAIEDGEIRSTVASVLEGAEDVLSIFFNGSSSALRKVKTDRIKRKQITPTKERSCEPGRLPSTPSIKTGEVGNTQWSPLSLSEIPPCTVDTSCRNGPATQVENNILTERPQHGSDSGQQFRSRLKITDLGFSKKNRKFVYTVDTLKLQTQGEDTQSQKVDSLSGIPNADQEGNVKQLVKALDDTNCCIRKIEMEKEGNPTEENLLPSVQAKVQDLDISQLSKDFAQDFSQMPDPGKLCKVAGDNPQNGFSPSACLSAMKEAHQKVSRANLHRDITVISNRRFLSTAKQNDLINEGTISDSGFQSAAEDTTHVTASSFVLPSSENNDQQQSQECTGFQTHIHRTPHISSTHKGNGKAHSSGILQEAETDVKLANAVKETQTLCPSREYELPMKSTSMQQCSSAKGAVDNINCTPHSVHGSLPEQTTVSLPSVHASGFKTASNKSMEISLANLERAGTEGEKPCARVTRDELSTSHGSVENTAFYSNQQISSSIKFLENSCQLTASQKADVTELCTILEEADSQFEFTQFRTPKLQQHSEDNATSPRKDDKELDPDFLTGINFDDSFNAENHLTVSKARALFADIEENLVQIEKSPDKQSDKIGAECSVDSQNDNFVCKEEDRGRLTCSDRQVSGLTDEDVMKLPENGKINTTKCQSGFQMASGKGISLSAKAMQEAEAFFKGCDILDTNSGMSTKYEKSIKPLSGSITHKKNLHKCKNAQAMKASFCEEPINECENVTLRPATHHAEDAQNNLESSSVGFKNIPSLTNTASFHGNPSSTAQPLSSLSCTKSENIGSASINKLSSAGGFRTASGEKVFLSADSVRKAECLLNDIHTLKDASKQLKQKGDTVRAGHLASLVPMSTPKSGGFQTASGKGVNVSSAALKKAKSLLSEYDERENNLSVKPTHSKMPVPGPPPSNGGFLAASGKPVTFSSDALQKAKALFSDISFSAEIPGVSDTRNNDKKQDSGEHMEKTHCGFTTAGGAKVHVSQKNLLKAKKLLEELDDGSISVKAMQESDAFFKDSDFMDGKDSMLLKHRKPIAPLGGSGSDKINLTEFKRDQKMTNIPEDPGSGHTELKNVTVGQTVKSEKMLHPDDVEIFSKVFKNTLDSTKTASLNGSTSLMATSSSLGTALKNVGCSSVSELSNSDGFCTASGKKVTVSDEAMTKAKSLLNENDAFEDANKQQQNGGFQTASGKGFAVSSAALKKAKALLSECEGVEEKICAKPTHSKMPVPGPPPSNGGFLAASGKPVAFSSDALQKAKTLFSDIGFSAEIPGVSDTRKNDKKHDGESMEKTHCGFKTAGGIKVHVSQKNLLKAKKLLDEFDDGSISVKAMQESDAFFKDCNFMDGKDSMLLKHRKPMAPLGGSGSDKINLTEFKRDQKMTNIPEDPGSGHTELKNVTVGQTVNSEKMLHPDDVEIFSKVFKNTLDSTKTASLNGSTSLMTTSSSLGTALKNVGCSSVSELSNGDGFCTASGKKVTVSDEAMTKAKSLLNENDAFEDANKQQQNGGFQTASGKGVAVSSAALKKAKALLSECEGVEEKICAKPTHSKMPVPGPPPSNGGFLAASGKPVAFSSDALQKAKALFSDIGFSAEIPGVSDTRNNDKKHDGESMEKTHCGFKTAGGAKVHVSQKNLLKAKKLLKDFADGECFDSESYSTSPPTNAHKSDLSEVKDAKRTSNSNLSPAGDKDLHPEKSDPRLVKSVTSLQATHHENETMQHSRTCGSISINDEAEKNITRSRVGNLYDSPREEMSSVSSSEGLKVKGTEESSILSFQSLNLTGCTETQQMFFAQEALECTKALLEDEHLAGQSLSVTSENMPLQENSKSSEGSAEEQKGKGKRPVDDPDKTAQPPLKRRLLEEFDRTVDGPRGSTLHSIKSSPNGAMKDRRVFRYSVSLHPNITRPHRNGKNYVETISQKTTSPQHLTPGDSRSACSRMPVFVPLFLKNSKTESHKNTVFKDNLRTPSAFVPPFKKQRTIVQESSSKPQEQDKRCHLVVMPFNSSSYASPTEKTQSTTGVTGNKIEDDIQTFVVVDTANDNLMNNLNQGLTCDSEDSAAEASGVEDTLPRSQDMFQNLHNVELARDMQDMRIRKKKRQTIRPLPGSLFLTKTSGVSRIPLNAAVDGKPPARYTQKQLYSYGVHPHVYEITSETAESFRFSLQQFIKQEAFIDRGGVQLADGGWLIPSNDGTAGKEEFYRSLCDTPGVDPKLISEEWVYNHYRWIVWKQASMERSFPKTMGSLCLTPERVLLQLKYRYDVEVDHSRRPALRKIMEKDDTAAKTLVLCVCGVVSRGQSPKRHSFSDTKTTAADAKVDNPSAVVWLTDGWYGIKAQLDEPLTAMLHRGRLAVGGKIIIHGAQLVGSQDACSPLEAPESLMLKICANSSRLARWDSKLGFYRDPRPFLLPVSSLYSNGGPVGCVDIIILRSYPIQWMERKPDGGVVFRSVRAEEKEARRYESQKQKAMEILFAKIQAEFEKEEKANNKPQRRRQSVSCQDFASLQDGEELFDAAGDDPAYFEIHLSVQQLETLRAYRRSLMEKKQAELQDRYRRALENAEDREGSCPKRDVTPVWRLCIADCMDQPGSVYQLNLWRPPSDLQSLLKEGCRYKVYNLTTSEGKKPGGSTAVQLTGTKKTQFQDLQASQEWLSTHFQPRVSAHFMDLQNPEFQPLCGEVDLTGYVTTIIDGQGFSPAFYLADGNLNFVKVRCFSSLAQSGLEDVVKPRVLLALSNLQLRGQSTSPVPVVYAGDLTVFSTNPKEVHLQESLSRLRNIVQGQENMFLTAEEKLSQLIKSDGVSSISSPALQMQTPTSTRDTRQDAKTSVTSQPPVKSFGAFTPVSRDPPAAKCSTEKDPSSLKRRRALDYLSRIPSPPPLSLLGSAASPCVKKTFIPPRRSGTPCTLKTVQTTARKPVNSLVEDEWVNDEELAMIDTQALLVGDLV
nr:breast cancer type 2 susceptibility protein isoform X2 [Scatophagus argus]